MKKWSIVVRKRGINIDLYRSDVTTYEQALEQARTWIYENGGRYAMEAIPYKAS
jgi:hypothetical protein